ncbi:MAG: hypothetical protein AVDCRST_MAG56-6979 [uncultured Cytophagales bacterium]|uniref:Uncharacterized protein n=1 Tax=uncultured Cytophagales bacterium TaxID=158755 RepID=A0A6J4L804_9SPHI|nr:MAG: hypothetical protein AVDCRST_MAG56-6979 [uncultured Cytophagales bacterium]
MSWKNVCFHTGNKDGWLKNDSSAMPGMYHAGRVRSLNNIKNVLFAWRQCRGSPASLVKNPHTQNVFW